MRKPIAIIGLALMAVGLILTAFGTQQSPTSQLSQQISCPPNGCLGTGSYATTFIGQCAPNVGCQGTVVWVSVSTVQSTGPNFTLNHVGMFLGVLGSVLFASLYPKRISSSPPINALFLKL
jgi:hypothetical protein